MVRAAMPTSCRRSASSTMILELSSQPRRVLTVTGLPTASTTALVMATILSGSRIMPEPAPRPAILLTGQPKLMSMMSAPWPPASSAALSAIFAASTMASGKLPYIWTATGASSSRVCILAMVFWTSRTSPSELTNSVVTMAAPASRQRMRKLASVTSSMGARVTGRSPRSMLPIFTFSVFGAGSP